MTLHSRYINGNLAYWDTHQNRIVDAYGASVVKYINHFTHLALDNTTRNPDDWCVFTDSGADTITLPVSVTGGVMQLTTDGADNNEVYMQLGGAACVTNAPFVIAGALGAANSKPLYFGARVKPLAAVDECYFVGLAEEGSAVDGFIVDNTGAIVNKDFIGFCTLTGSAAAWRATWKVTDGAVQAITAIAVNASDWHTFEFFYDGVTTVRFYADGVLNATVATTTAATFPYAEEMSPIIGVKTGAAAAKSLQVDWLRCVQFG
jgi:hypothetical protein